MRNKKSKSYTVRSLSYSDLFVIYDLAVSLGRQGRTIQEIKNVIQSRTGFDIRKNTIYRWISGRNSPKGNMRIFSAAKPSPDLSYVIGVFLGDGSIKTSVKNYQYSIRLKVRDKKFAEVFAERAARLLGKKSPYKVYLENDNTRGGIRYVAQASSKGLYQFLSQDTGILLNYVKPFISDFIKGLFDSDGFTSISAGRTFNVGAGVVGTDRTLLEFVRELLKENGIKSSIQLPIKKGKRVVIWGKEYFAKKNVYFLNLSGIKNSELFLKKIGFSFPRKHEKLREAIEIKKKYSDSDALTEWKNRYFKASREWVRRSEADSGGSPETSS